MKNSDKNELNWLLNPILDISENICKLFGDYCEVLIYEKSVTGFSIKNIFNGHISKYEIGDEMSMTDKALVKKIEETDKNYYGPFYRETRNGKELKSIASIIKDKNSKVCGAAIVSIDLNAPISAFVESFKRRDNREEDSEAIQNIDGIIHKAYREVFINYSLQEGVSPTERNKLIVYELYDRGIFNIKGAVEKISEKMGISKYTIYNYLNNKQE